MNGAVMKNFVTPSAPFASALVGDPELFVSEVDESDGSIALFRPQIAVVGNISRLTTRRWMNWWSLFHAFVAKAKTAVLNLDNDDEGAGGILIARSDIDV
jgi:UDP-N-acetylmuramate--alanine ligase